jgi:hypothetical protein
MTNQMERLDFIGLFFGQTLRSIANQGVYS